MGHGDDDEPNASDRPDDGYDDAHDHELADAPRSAIPDPLDRIWRHPTELPLASCFTPADGARAHDAHRSRSWGVPLAMGAAGALVAVAVLAVAGAFHHDSATEPLGTRTTRDTVSAPEVAATVGASVLTVVAHDGAQTRRGSGVCVRHGGEFLTTAHVVGNASSVDVYTSDGRAHPARVIGRDRTTDLVLLALDVQSQVPAAHLASATPAMGAGVWVVGAPAPGTNNAWMSGGVLSSDDEIVATIAGPVTSGLIETDAVTSDAAAGGALVDHGGAVVGIVLGHVGATGTTYAIPIANAVSVAEELHEDGVAKHGSAGFTGENTLAGPTVASVVAAGPAARAGMHAGDIVVAVDGRPVDSMADVEALVRGHDPGQPVTFRVGRGRTRLDMTVVLGSTTG